MKRRFSINAAMHFMIHQLSHLRITFSALAIYTLIMGAFVGALVILIKWTHVHLFFEHGRAIFATEFLEGKFWEQFIKNVLSHMDATTLSLSIALYAVAFLFFRTLNLGLVNIALHLFGTDQASVYDLTPRTKFLPVKGFCAGFLYEVVYFAPAAFSFYLYGSTYKVDGFSAVIVIGFITVVSVYLTVRSLFYQQFLVDQDAGIIECFIQSFNYTRNNWFKSFFLMIAVRLSALLILLPLILVCVYLDKKYIPSYFLFVGLPYLEALAFTHAYKQLDESLILHA